MLWWNVLLFLFSVGLFFAVVSLVVVTLQSSPTPEFPHAEQQEGLHPD